MTVLVCELDLNFKRELGGLSHSGRYNKPFSPQGPGQEPQLQERADAKPALVCVCGPRRPDGGPSPRTQAKIHSIWGKGGKLCPEDPQKRFKSENMVSLWPRHTNPRLAR